MASQKSLFSSTTTQLSPDDEPLRVPRLDSLQHRLQHAKDADGQPSALLDELLFLLDDPPAGTADRWQEGADLCASHGIKTSRMSVWRFYRAHILQWRREQNPAPPAAPPDPLEITRLEAQARHLVAQRVLDLLNDPRLAPGHLIGLLQNDNHRQKLELARDQFNDRLDLRRREEERERNRRRDEKARPRFRAPVPMESMRKFLAGFAPIPPHPTP